MSVPTEPCNFEDTHGTASIVIPRPPALPMIPGFESPHCTEHAEAILETESSTRATIPDCYPAFDEVYGDVDRS
jgi:hypothetical protein